MCRSGRTTKVDRPVVARSASDPAMVKEESHSRKGNANRCQKGFNYSNSLLGFSGIVPLTNSIRECCPKEGNWMKR
jgi:hypothetical protein